MGLVWVNSNHLFNFKNPFKRKDNSKTSPHINMDGFYLTITQTFLISKSSDIIIMSNQINNQIAERLHLTLHIYIIKSKTAWRLLEIGFPTRQGMEPPSASVSLERNTLGSTRTSCNPAHTWPTTHFAWVYRMYITNGWDQQPSPDWDSIDRFRNKRNFSR